MSEETQMVDKTTSLVSSFNETLEKGNIVDTFSQVGEFAIDQAIQNNLLKDIPVFGLLVSGYKTILNIKDYNLTQKIYRFLYHLQDTTPEQRQKFIRKYVDTNQENAAASLLDILEKLNNANSVPLVCNLMKAVIEEQISIAQFNRLIIAIQRTAYTDLVKLEKYINEYDEDGLSDALQAAGLIYQSSYDGGSPDSGENNSKFKINQNGYLLLRYGFLRNKVHESPRFTEINAGPMLEELSNEDIDQLLNDKTMSEFDIEREK